MNRLLKFRARKASSRRRYPRRYERIVPVALAAIGLLIIAVLVIIGIVLSGGFGMK